MSNWYRAGTISVTNGSTAVAGSGVAWLANVKAGDLIVFANGTFGEVASDPASNTAITLAQPYAGTTGSGQSYAIARFSDGWRPTAELAIRLANFLASATDVLSGTGVPSAGLGGDGSVYFRQDVPEYYAKSGGSWGSAISLTGPPGQAGPGLSTTSASTHTIGTGTKAFAIASGGLAYLGLRLRAARTASPTNYIEGIVTAATSTSITITVASANDTGGSGTFSGWSIGIAGNPGIQGPAGSPSTGTSVSSNTIGTGDKVFAVPTSLDLTVGQLVRFAVTASPDMNWMQGTIVALAGGSMTIRVPNDGASKAGSGTFSAWSFGLIGARGLQGATGATGATGPASTIPGPSYDATATDSRTIGPGIKTFTIGTGKAYVVGSLVRVASAAAPKTKWMEGPCTGYSGGVIDVDVERTGTGTGTAADWNLSIAGTPGADGLGAVSSINGVGPVTAGDVVLTDADIPSAHTPVNFAPTGDGSKALHMIAGLDAELANMLPASDNLAGLADKAAARISLGVSLPSPQGRLTLTAGVPIPFSDVTAATNIYYSPLIGDLVAIFNGSDFEVRSILSGPTDTTGLILPLNSNSDHAGYHQASKVFDVFAAIVSGVLYFGTAVAWSTVTSRGTGAGTSELEMFAGRFVNKQSINLRYGTVSGEIVTVPARQATYLGSFATSANGQTEMTILPAPAAGGTANKLYLWNAYNQVPIHALCRDATDTWTYQTATVRMANNSSANRISFVTGLAGASLSGRYCTYSRWAASSSAIVGVGYDSRSAFMAETFPNFLGINGTSVVDAFPMVAPFDKMSGDVGYHYVQSLEWANSAAPVTFLGDNNMPSLIQTGLSLTVNA